MPKHTPEQLLSQANTVLHRTLNSMRVMEIDLHRYHVCLPMPRLYAPQTPEAMDAYASELLSNLYDPATGHHNRSAAWSQAEDCPHLGPDTVFALYHVIDSWRCLVGCAAGHTQRQRDVFGLSSREEHLRTRLNDYEAALRVGNPGA